MCLPQSSSWSPLGLLLLLTEEEYGCILASLFFFVSENVSWQMGVESEIVPHKVLILIVYNTAAHGDLASPVSAGLITWQIDSWGHGLSSKCRTH